MLTEIVREKSDHKSFFSPQDARAVRVCTSEGEWLHGNWTNYTVCFDRALPGLLKMEKENEQYLKSLQIQEVL